MSEFIQVDTYLQNLRREASDNAIQLFKLEIESKGGHTLSTSEFDEMYGTFYRKVSRQFEEGCDRFVENYREMEEEIARCKPVHLQKLKYYLKELKYAMKKADEFKRDKKGNFARLLSELWEEIKQIAWSEFEKIRKQFNADAVKSTMTVSNVFDGLKLIYELLKYMMTF